LFAFAFLVVGGFISAVILKRNQKKDPTPAVITDIIPRD
jgi:hypothetical protein